MTTDSDRRSDWIVFILGLGSNLHINVGGYLAISEALGVFLGTAALFRLYRRPGDTHAKTACSLGLLWLASALFADVWNGTTLELMLKGLSKAGLIVLQLALAYELLRSDLRRIRWYFVGVLLSSLLSIYILKPGSIAAFEQLHGLVLTDSFEKQWITVVINFVLVVWFFTGSSYPALSTMAVAIIGAFAIFSGSRSAGALLIVAGFSVYVVKFSAKIEGGRVDQHATRRMFLILALLTLGALVFSGYGIAAYTGRLGDRAAEKYIAQSESSFGLLFGGRGDFLAGLLAVQASPIFGHGTWKSDVKGYRFQAAHIIGMEYFAMEDGSGGRVGGHSNILEAWAEHGVLAVLFWVYLFYFIIRCLSTGIYYHFALLGPLLFLLYSRIWDFFFSPINGRTSLAFTFALFILVVLRAERLSRAPPPSINLPPLGDRLVSPQGPSNLSSPARRSVP